MNQFSSYKYLTYLIGAMGTTAEGDDGSAKREHIVKELLHRMVFPINPVTLEKFKTGQNVSHNKTLLTKWLTEGNLSEYAKHSRLIWKGEDIITEKGELIHIPGDFDYVDMSHWLTFIYNKGDQPAGSIGEIFCGFKNNKPVYLITNLLLDEIRDSIKQCIFGSGGRIFNSDKDYLFFIDAKYNL